MTRPLYLKLHRVSLADEVEQAEAEMMRNTHTRPARIDEPETIITDFGGLAEPRPNIVKRAFDAIAPDDAKLLGQLDAETRAQVQCNRDHLMAVIHYLPELAVIAACLIFVFIMVTA